MRTCARPHFVHTQRCRPSFSLLSTPRIAWRCEERCLACEELRRAARLALESYPLSACILSGRLRGRPRLLLRGGIASTISTSVVVSATLAPVHFRTRGIPLRSTIIWRFVPGLPLSVGFLPVPCSPFLPLWHSLFASPKKHETNLSHLPG